MVEAIVEMSVDSMDLNPDTVLRTIQNISALEAKEKK